MDIEIKARLNWVAGKTPSQFDAEVSNSPLQAEVCDNYDITKEHIQHPVYAYELATQKLKRCL